MDTSEFIIRADERKFDIGGFGIVTIDNAVWDYAVDPRAFVCDALVGLQVGEHLRLEMNASNHVHNAKITRVK